MSIAEKSEIKLLGYERGSELKRELIDANLEPTDAIQALFSLLHKSFRFKRLLFLKREYGALHSSIILGVDIGSSLSDMHLSIPKQKLFYELLRKPKTVWLDAGTQQRFSILMHKEFQQLFSSDNYCCASMFHGPRALGLVIADKVTNGLTEKCYQEFIDACELANQSMAREFEQRVKQA